MSDKTVISSEAYSRTKGGKIVYLTTLSDGTECTGLQKLEVGKPAQAFLKEGFIGVKLMEEKDGRTD